MKDKLVAPHSLIIEQTACSMAAEYFEIGMSQGLPSKCKTHKEFARKNWPKFIPRAIDVLITMLGMDSVPEDQKKLIFEALRERKDYGTDPIPEIDISKVIPTKPKPPVIINTLKPEFDIEKEPLPMKV